MNTAAQRVVLLLLLCSSAAATPVVRREATVSIDVNEGTLKVRDTLYIPQELLDERGRVRFLLNSAFAAPAVERGTLEGLERPAGGVQVARARPEGGVLTLVYGGVVNTPPRAMEQEHARSFSETPGIISREGVYLAPRSAWLAHFKDALVETTLTVSDLPASWGVVTEGSPKGQHEDRRSFVSERPTDGVHLVAGPWTREKAQVKDVLVEVLLRTPDPALAQRYLDVARQYLLMYEELLGPYPWSRFSIVENFWETGYGMPSFTLLGPKVIRFPFLLHSSFPHELLHNWWGNGVYPEPGAGNWSEGLTAYLADHLVQEQRGKGEAYRKDALIRYADYVEDAADFPLRTFRERRSRASEAVGYGKWMMVVHMLRRELGDDVFKEGLRRFFAEHKYERATFEDLRASLEHASGRSLESFFHAWLDHTGAPSLAWREVRASRADARSPWALEVTVAQTQRGTSVPALVPVAAALADGTTVYGSARFRGGLVSESATATFTTTSEPLKVLIDPHYDVFRALHEGETPPTLSRALGGDRMVFVLPTLASEEERTQWRGFAEKVCGPPSARCSVVSDEQVRTLPDDAAVWVLGYGNNLRAAAVIGALKSGASFDDGSFRVAGQAQDNADHSLALAFEHPRNPQEGLAFVAADRASAIPGLARKLPHYGKYGYLGFRGEEPANVLKGGWAAVAQPLVADVKPNASATFALEERKALASLPPPFDAAPLVATVTELASPAYEGRGYGSRGLLAATAYVERALSAAGFAADAVSRRCFDDDKGPRNQHVRACNLVATLVGKDPSLPAVILGAHLDHLGYGWPEARTGAAGKLHPGANDNASGVAVLLAVARKLRAEGPRERTLHIVFFTGEEAGLRGSRRFVEELGEAPEGRVLAMVNLDTVGRRDGGPFLVAGHESATEWVHAFMGVGFVTGVESKMAARGIAASDHQPFLERGIPAVHVFTGPSPGWHTPEDRAAEVEPHTLVDAAVLTHELAGWLADRGAPLTSPGAREPGAASPADASAKRKVALGTIPDMSFTGRGVRLKGTTPGSPAAMAGLQAGDVLLRFGEREVADLRGLADALRDAEAGQRVKLTLRRGAEDVVIEVTLSAR